MCVGGGGGGEFLTNSHEGLPIFTLDLSTWPSEIYDSALLLCFSASSKC